MEGEKEDEGRRSGDTKHLHSPALIPVIVPTLIATFFPEGWQPKTRFSSHDHLDRLRLLALAGLILGLRLTVAMTVVLKPGRSTREFIHELNAEMRRKRCAPIRYIGMYCSFRVDPRHGPCPHRHVHFIIEWPKGEAESVLTQFLIRYGGLKGGRMPSGQHFSPAFQLWKRAAQHEPMKPVHLVKIDNTRRGFDGLPGLINGYLSHHEDDVGRLGEDFCGEIAITVAAEIRTLAELIGKNRPDAISRGVTHILAKRGCAGEAVLVPACCMPRCTACAAHRGIREIAKDRVGDHTPRPPHPTDEPGSGDDPPEPWHEDW